MKVAIVHDWLVVYGGSERVLEQIIDCFPDADLFSLVDFLAERSCLRGKPVHTSFIQKLPFAKKHYRNYLPLMPIAVEQLDLSSYDLVISSSHAVAKGVLTGPNQLHVSYVHSPIRYAWDLQHQYLKEAGLDRGLKSLCARALLHYIRNWDARSANGVDHMIANSGFVGRRINKVYRRNSTILHPPVALDRFLLATNKEDFYVTASRMVPYKRIDLIVKAFSQTPHRQLVVIGDGPEMKKVAALAGPNVHILGYQPFDVLHDHLQRAKGFVFAAEEDFGIAVVEAQACGTPVIAYGRGGALESVRLLGIPQPTGIFFETQTVEALLDALERFENSIEHYTPANCRSNAERFSEQDFRDSFKSLLEVFVEHSKLSDFTRPSFPASAEQHRNDMLQLVR